MADVGFTRISLGGVAVLGTDADFFSQFSRMPEWADEVNTLTLPAGEKPGTGLFLVSPSNVNSLTVDQTFDILEHRTVLPGVLSKL